MKAIRNLLVFAGIYLFEVLFVFILSFDKLNFHDIAQNGGMMVIGGLVAMFTTICYAIEQDLK